MNGCRWIAFVWLWSLSVATAAVEEKVCNSIDVRNSGERLSALHNCTIVNGSVQIVLLDATTPSDFDISFPLLREITQYLVVYRVAGLYNLGKLFPNLMLIRGSHSPHFPGLALMIHDNLDLREIGLYSLTNITRGSVIISKNPKLCHATTIDWGQIANGVSNDINVINSDEPAKCKGCSNIGCPDDLCWSREVGRCQYGKLNGCHPLCAGGCDEPHSARHCFACTAYMHKGECIRECPYGMYGHIRSCLTEEECHSLPVTREESTPDDLNSHYIPFERICRDECPYGFQVTADKRNCTLCTRTRYGHCQRNCNSFKISDDMLRKNYEYRLHTNCTTIKSLEIEVKYGNSEEVERRLEEYIGKVEVILDQLKIIRSYSLTSLNFLRSLYEIRGVNTVNKMALVIRGNKNLQKLWTTSENETRPVKILNGTVSFHYNPKLCMSEIYKFGNLSTLPAFSDIEVSVISNGDQFACTVYNLQVETVKIDTQSILLQMHKPVEADNLERFLVYFIEASKWNETIEATDCEDSSWRIDDISSKKALNETDVFHVITNLEPNTEYIYYVKTYTISSKTSMSSIFRNKTLPSKPSSPQYFNAQPVSSSEVELTWKPPSHPHGKLVKYIIKGIHLTDDQAMLDERSYCRNKTSNGNGIIHKSFNHPPIIKPSSDDTCEKQCEPQKNIVNNICNTFEHGIDMDLISLNNHRYTFESCSSNILNIFISSKCLAMQNNDDTVFPSAVNTFINENCTEMWSVSNMLNNVTHKDGSSSYFQIQLNENVTSFNLGNLKHYSQYLLSILVCREIVKQELNQSSINSCSQETLISFRTLENKQADIIDSDSVRHEVINNHTVNILWESPILINSIIHSFQLSYKRVEAPNFVSVCITMKEYENAGRSYFFKNIQPGVYQYKIQAISLYGPGPYTTVKEFNLPYPDAFNSWHIILIIFICGCILIGLTGVIIRTHFSRKNLERNAIFNLANNPGYIGIYVEDQWEVPRENVKLLKILGRGTFGTVHEGLLMPDSRPCAVKSVSKTNFLRYHAEFLNEAAIMKKFSEAYHIVELLAVVTRTHPPLLIMELMGHGDLKSLLVKSKNSGDPPPPNSYTIIRMAAQIADGMAFLEYNKFIHRDLAARNCMVANDSDMTVKIGDFGMSRQIYNGDYYRKGNKGEMPIRWMAPESLSEGIFTSQSDVWSYGIVIWEIVTLGAQPYLGKSNNEVMAYVLDGNLLTMPTSCPDILKDIVRLCWNWTASQRPRFLKVVETLDLYLEEKFRSVSFYHSHGLHNESPADQSLMSPCTTYEEDVDNDSICSKSGDATAAYSALHVCTNKMSNGHLSPM